MTDAVHEKISQDESRSSSEKVGLLSRVDEGAGVRMGDFSTLRTESSGDDSSTFAAEDFSDVNSVISDLASEGAVPKPQNSKIMAYRRHPKSSQVITYRNLIVPHSARPVLASITDDGLIVASCSKGELIVQEVFGGGLRFKTPAHNGEEISALSMSADGNIVATAGLDSCIHIFDVRKGELIRNIFEPHDDKRISSISLSANGETLVSGGYDGRVVAYHVETGESFYQSEDTHDGEWVLGVSCSADGSMIASGGYDGQVAVHYTKGKGLAWKKKKAHKKKWVSDVAISGNGLTVASCGRDGKVRSYDIRVEDTVGTVKRKGEQFRCVSLSSDAEWLIAGTNKGEVITASPQTGEERVGLKGLFTAPIYSAALSSHGDRFVVATYAHTPVIFGNIEGDAEVSSTPISSPVPKRSSSDPAMSTSLAQC